MGDQHDDDYGGFLPPEDRVWRHPAEIGAIMAAASAAPVVPKRPWGVALFSALGGALVVATVFMAIGQPDPDLIVVQERVAVQTVTTEPRVVEPEEWANEVGLPTQTAVAKLTVVADGEIREGSGIALRDDGHLVTMADLVDEADSIDVTLHDGTRLSGSVVGIDSVSSLAVVHADGALDVAVQAEAMDLEPGDPVAVVGSRRADLNPSEVVRVRATVVDRQARAHHDLVVLDGSLAESQVGGAVVSDSGAVVGLANRVEGSTYDALVVPIEVIRAVTAQIIENGTVDHEAWIGVDVTNYSGDGVYVTAVIFDGPGFSAGLKTGDIITEFNGELVTSSDALVAKIRSQSPDEALTLTVRRRDEHMEPTLTLGRRPLVD